MATYVILAKFTEQGVKSIRGLQSQIEHNDQVAASQGIKLTRYFTHGEYDMVVIADAPTDEAVMLGLLGVGSAGNLQTVSMKAYSQGDFLSIIKKLPAPGIPPAPKAASKPTPKQAVTRRLASRKR